MLPFLTKHSAYQIGLDLTENELRALTLCLRQNPYDVIDATTIQLTKLDNKESPLIVALYLLRKKIPSYIKKMIIGIPCDKVIMQDFEIDAGLCNKEIYQYLLLKTAHLSKHFNGETLIDFIVTASQGNGKNIITCIIVAKNYVLELTKQCKQAGFKVIAIDVSALALQRIAPKKQPFMFIDHDAILFQEKKESFPKTTSNDHVNHIATAINRLLQMHYSNNNIGKLFLSGVITLNEQEKQKIASLCQVEIENFTILNLEKSFSPYSCAYALATWSKY